MEIALFKSFCNDSSDEFFLSFQIGIVDIMNETRLQIQGVVGCGLSEIVAAYQDGCLSREQCVRLAFLIGKLLKECSSICLFIN